MVGSGLGGEGKVHERWHLIGVVPGSTEYIQYVPTIPATNNFSRTDTFGEFELTCLVAYWFLKTTPYLPAYLPT